MKTALVAQCGGPSVVINATLATLVRWWITRESRRTRRIWGARFGLRGLARPDWVDLTDVSDQKLSDVASQPGAALGSGRDRPADADFPAIVDYLAVGGVDTLFLIGGNGTMAAALKLEKAARAEGLSLQVIGVPKTVDNDLVGCDFAPGYGSAARYIAHTTWSIGLDLRSLRGFDQVTIMEVMGRHTGWLAGAASLARYYTHEPPDIITLPEGPVDPEEVVARIAQVFEEQQTCVAVVAEGTRNRAGRYWAELAGDAGLDPSGQRVFSMAAGAGAYLVEQVQRTLKLRCRHVKPNSAQRSAHLLRSPTDRFLAELAGRAAVEASAAGHTGVIPLIRRNGPTWGTLLAPLKDVAGRERPVPAEYIHPSRMDVTPYFTSLIREVSEPQPRQAVLWTQEEFPW